MSRNGWMAVSLGALLLLPVATAAAPRQEGESPPQLTGPAWEIQPRPVYPPEALAADVRGGAVVLQCDVLADRRVTDCEIVSERPRGHRFGRAAIQSVRQARISEAGLEYVIDGKARFTITFRR